MERHFSQKLRYPVERLRFSCWTIEIFMWSGRDFHVERSRFSWWTVEIFMWNGRGFHDERPRFSWWTAEIFMLNGQDFHGERSAFSWWTVQIFSRWQVMIDQNFHNDRSRIALLLWLKSRSARGTSSHPAFSFHPRVSLIYLVDEFFFLQLN